MNQIQQQEEELKQLQKQLDELTIEKNQLLEQKREIEQKNSIYSMKLAIEEENKKLQNQCNKLLQQLYNKEISLNEFSTQYLPLKQTLLTNTLLLQKHQ